MKTDQQKSKAAEASKRWRDANPDKVLAGERRRRAEFPEQYRTRYRDKNLRRLYGITEVEALALLEAQGGRCAICGEEVDLFVGLKGPRAGVIDHCHTTGRIRGILHTQCNVGLGAFGESTERLEAAIAYLRAHTTDTR